MLLMSICVICWFIDFGLFTSQIDYWDQMNHSFVNFGILKLIVGLGLLVIFTFVSYCTSIYIYTNTCLFVMFNSNTYLNIIY